MVSPWFSHVFPTFFPRFLDATVSVGLFVFNPQEAIQETWQRRFDRAEGRHSGDLDPGVITTGWW